MQPVPRMRMNVYRQLAAIQGSVLLAVTESRIARIIVRSRYGVTAVNRHQLAGEDIIPDIIIKKTGCNGYMLRVPVDARIRFGAYFGVQGGITVFIFDGAFVHTVGRQFGNIGRPEAARYIEFQGKVTGGRVGQSRAAGDIRKVTSES